ncbi:Outer membrane porin protein 32 precursor [Janthinobacterium sp. KBS0711]|uniref:porin n=1 Tax=Janthinobacterium sp. KBS0711 TaxID=1649647 RepID=UPI0006277C51|nr:porin [Janthinobacterium sp. KBS0711]KKO61546.1 Outer membrane porin protein 32 precursor [Janthinobacterium sp. KBS0711]TSD73741.1 porin [Janthinobacterium sp. KBS0711]
MTRVFSCAAGALALAAALPAAAQENVQLYGRLNVALEALHTSGSGDSVRRVSNNRSVLGVRGSEDLGGGWQALFQVEGTLSPDTGAGSIAARDTRVGIAGPWGTLFAGNWTLPYNSATSALDPFYPTTAGYMSLMGNGAGATENNTSNAYSFDRRQQNSVHYWTPQWQGWSLRVARGMAEERPASGAHPSLTSAALLYDGGALYATVAHEEHRDYQGRGLSDRGSKLAIAWRVDSATQLAAALESLRYATATGELRRRTAYVSATRQFGRHGLRFGLAHAQSATGSALETIGTVHAGAGTGATHATIGYDYQLSKRSSLFAYYTRLANGRNGIADFAINSLGRDGETQGATLSGVALGIKHNF